MVHLMHSWKSPLVRAAACGAFLIFSGQVLVADGNVKIKTSASAKSRATSSNKESSQVSKYSSPFFDQIKPNFHAWDLDQDGALSGNEIELAVHNPLVKGEAAAAAASLRRGVRAHKDFAPVSLEKLAHSLQTKSTAEKPQPTFESMYESGLKKISTTHKELYADGAPKVETIAQGRLGDCFLIASLGACAYRSPERLMKFMQAQPNGKVLVNYGSGKQVELDPPTDAEIIIGATNKNTGTWANMYEMAVGTEMLRRSTSGKHVTPLSLIGVGGTPNVPMQILTGHGSHRHGCELYRKTVDANGASTDDLTPLREELKQAFAEGRLIVGGCGPKGKQALVKGIYYNHSYGVLEYDEKTDTVLFWNPLGNKHTPKGPEGLEFGYSTSHGRFRAPLKEVVMWFGSFSVETAELSEKYGPEGA